MVQIINHPVAIAAAVAAVQRQSSSSSTAARRSIHDDEFNNRFFQGQQQQSYNPNQQRFSMNRRSNQHQNPHPNLHQQSYSHPHHQRNHRESNPNRLSRSNNLISVHQQPHQTHHHHHGSHHHSHHSHSHHQHPISQQQLQQQYHQQQQHTPLLLDEDFTFISPLVKYSLFFFNFIFWLIGTTLICLGFWSFFEEEYQQYQHNQHQPHQLEHQLEQSEHQQSQSEPFNTFFNLKNLFDFILNISIGLICIGLIIFSMSLMGCLGALRENLCLIKLYSLMLLMLFVGEVTISSLAFIFPQTVLNFLKENLSKDMIIKYREDTNLQNLIDIIQLQFKCCGISDLGYKDWSKNIYFNCTKFNPSSERCAVPFSCCREIDNTDINSMCGYNMQNLSSVVEINKYVYTRGCVEAISELVDRNMNFVAIICLGSALAQLFAMFLARSLQGQIYAQRARWM